jgi:hypothetical protein
VVSLENDFITTYFNAELLPAPVTGRRRFLWAVSLYLRFTLPHATALQVRENRFFFSCPDRTECRNCEIFVIFFATKVILSKINKKHNNEMILAIFLS